MDHRRLLRDSDIPRLQDREPKGTCDLASHLNRLKQTDWWALFLCCWNAYYTPTRMLRLRASPPAKAAPRELTGRHKARYPGVRWQPRELLQRRGMMALWPGNGRRRAGIRGEGTPANGPETPAPELVQEELGRKSKPGKGNSQCKVRCLQGPGHNF